LYSGLLLVLVSSVSSPLLFLYFDFQVRVASGAFLCTLLFSWKKSEERRTKKKKKKEERKKR